MPIRVDSLHYHNQEKLCGIYLYYKSILQRLQDFDCKAEKEDKRKQNFNCFLLQYDMLKQTRYIIPGCQNHNTDNHQQTGHHDGTLYTLV